MLISISRASPMTNINPLPDILINKLARKYMYMPDITVRLRTLQVIPKGKNIGGMPRTTPHENAVAFARKNGIKLYVGYLITPESRSVDLRLVTHSFCVRDGEVIEPTEDIKWYPTVRYIGYPVVESEYDNFLYLNKFNRLFI